MKITHTAQAAFPPDQSSSVVVGSGVGVVVVVLVVRNSRVQPLCYHSESWITHLATVLPLSQVHIGAGGGTNPPRNPPRLYSYS